jgi:hypothetical protein
VDEKLEVNEKTPNLDEKPNGDEQIQMWMKQKKKMKKMKKKTKKKKKLLPLLLGHGDGVVMPSSGLSLDQCLLGSFSERSQLQQLRDQLLQH